MTRSVDEVVEEAKTRDRWPVLVEARCRCGRDIGRVVHVKTLNAPLWVGSEKDPDSAAWVELASDIRRTLPDKVSGRFELDAMHVYDVLDRPGPALGSYCDKCCVMRVFDREETARAAGGAVGSKPVTVIDASLGE